MACLAGSVGWVAHPTDGCWWFSALLYLVSVPLSSAFLAMQAAEFAPLMVEIEEHQQEWDNFLCWMHKYSCTLRYPTTHL